MTRRYDPSFDDRTVRHLFQCKMTDEQIAEHLHVSWSKVRRARERLGLGLPRKVYHTAKPKEPLPSIGPDENNPIVVARLTLGI